jgi:hypothetical protein
MQHTTVKLKITIGLFLVHVLVVNRVLSPRNTRDWLILQTQDESRLFGCLLLWLLLLLALLEECTSCGFELHEVFKW